MNDSGDKKGQRNHEIMTIVNDEDNDDNNGEINYDNDDNEIMIIIIIMTRTFPC